MFDKLYKEAVDDIPVNTALKEKLIRQAEEKPSQILPRRTLYIRRIGFAASAAAVLALAFNVAPLIKDGFDGDSAYLSTDIPAGTDTASDTRTEDALPDSASSADEASNPPAEEKLDKKSYSQNATSSARHNIDNPTPTASAVADTEAKETYNGADANAFANMSEEAPTSSATVADFAKAAEAVTAEEEAEEAEDASASEEHAPAVARMAGGAAVAVTESTAEDAEVNEADNASVYYGFDLSGLKLPTGVVKIGAAVQDGKTCTITYGGNGKSVTISFALSAADDIGTEEGESGEYVIRLAKGNSLCIVKTKGLDKAAAETLAASIQ